MVRLSLIASAALLVAGGAAAQQEPQQAVADEPPAAASADVPPQPDAPPVEEKEEPSSSIPFAIGGVVAAGALALALGGSSRKKHPAVLLLGPSGAGKTLLFHRLVHGEACETVASMKSAESVLDNQRLVDVPGHRRLRGAVRGELARASKVIFVVDAADATRSAKSAAELLYEVFCCETKPDLLVLCNKKDRMGAKTPARVKLTLASELETIHKTTKTLTTTGDDDIRLAPIDTGGKFFSFETHAPCKCEFLPFSAKDDSLDAVRAFLRGK